MSDWNGDKACRHPRKVAMLTAGQVFYRDITGKERIHMAYRCPDCGIRVETDLLVR